LRRQLIFEAHPNLCVPVAHGHRLHAMPWDTLDESASAGSTDDETPPVRESGHRTPQKGLHRGSRSRSRTPPVTRAFGSSLADYVLTEPAPAARPDRLGMGWWIEPLKEMVMSFVNHILTKQPKHEMKFMSGCSGMLSELNIVEAACRDIHSELCWRSDVLADFGPKFFD
jgi:hypothetical protein